MTASRDDDDNNNGTTNPTTPSTWREWKARATKQFQDGNYEGALYSYTQALRPFDDHHDGSGSGSSNAPSPSLSSSSSSFFISNSDRQILLSNIVACRLKIGGRVQAEAAVETAKRCIQLNPQWPKGHIRLASALIATDDPTKSNDACRSLQKALQLDPNNPTARDMLVKELRRDHRVRYNSSNNNNNSNSNRNSNNSTGGSTSTSTSTTTAGTSMRTEPLHPSAPPEYMDSPARNDNSNNTRQQQRQQRGYGSTDDIDIDDTTPPPPSSSSAWRHRFQFYLNRAKTWYGSQSDDVKTILKVMLVLVCLYVALGGRFGLEYCSFGSQRSITSTSSNIDRRRQEILSKYNIPSSSSTSSSSTTTTSSGGGSTTASTTGRTSNNNGGGGKSRTTTAGNYGKGNAYDEFYNDRSRRQQHVPHDDQYYHHHHDDGWDRYDHHRQRRSGSRRSSSSSSYYYGGDTGGVPNMLILAGAAYLGHRMGINPFQTLFYANMVLNGGRGPRARRMMFGPGFGGLGGGFGGFGPGFGRARYGRQRPHGGGMWWG